jgi:hypothetical protein
MTSENVQGGVEGKGQAAGGKKGTLVDALFDIGLAWAEFGVGQGKKALETSAKTLEKAAHSLNDLQQKLRKDAQA